MSLTLDGTRTTTPRTCNTDDASGHHLPVITFMELIVEILSLDAEASEESLNFH